MDNTIAMVTSIACNRLNCVMEPNTALKEMTNCFVVNLTCLKLILVVKVVMILHTKYDLLCRVYYILTYHDRHFIGKLTAGINPMDSTGNA